MTSGVPLRRENDWRFSTATVIPLKGRDEEIHSVTRANRANSFVTADRKRSTLFAITIELCLR
jgi:hypothetical protein